MIRKGSGSGSQDSESRGSAIPRVRGQKALMEESGSQDVDHEKGVSARVENSLQTVDSAMRRKEMRKNSQVETRLREVGEVEVPFGEIRVQTEIRWSVAQRYDYDCRVY